MENTANTGDTGDTGDTGASGDARVSGDAGASDTPRGRPAGSSHGAGRLIGLAEWMRGRSDGELARLLALRPDLAIAPPGSTSILAGRAGRRMSVQRASDALDTADMAVLAVLVAYGADADPAAQGTGEASAARAAVTLDTVRDALAPHLDRDTVDAAVSSLRARALLWDAGPVGSEAPSHPPGPPVGSPAGGPGAGLPPAGAALRTVAAAREILPWPAELVVGHASRSGPPARAGGSGDTERTAAAEDGDAEETEGTAGAGGNAGDSTPGAGGDAAADLPGRIRALGEDERALFDALAVGGGLGRTRDAADGSPADRPVQRLLRTGLVIKVDENTVRMPEDVRAAAAASPPAGGIRLERPDPHRSTLDPAEADAAAATEASELLRHADAVIGSLGRRPVPELRDGGVGVRELGRLAKELSLDVQRTAFLLEILAQADLIRAGTPDGVGVSDGAGIHRAPAAEVDGWTARAPADRWAVLAQAWLAMQRRTWAAGRRGGSGKAIPALGADLAAPAIAADRLAVLRELADEPPGTAIAAPDLVSSLRWRHPRRYARLPAGLVERLLDEARGMGAVSGGAITGPGRALLQRDDDPAAAMAAAMPDPVDHVLIQADLTMIAPGPLEPELAERIDRVADVESAGAATVYRISEDSLRRALDSGMSATELHALFAGASSTPVPQALGYLIDDVARKHGRLRVGYASSFVRSEDPALLTEVLTGLPGLGLRRIAPTVAVGPLDLADLLDALDDAGVAAVGEDRHGSLVDLRPRGARIAAPRRVRRSIHRPEPAGPTDEQIADVIAAMRAGDRAETRTSGEAVRTDDTRESGAAVVSLLQTAARAGRTVSIGYVDAQGVGVTRVVRPVSFSGGALDTIDPVTGMPRAFSLHRITSVSLVD